MNGYGGWYVLAGEDKLALLVSEERVLTATFGDLNKQRLQVAMHLGLSGQSTTISGSQRERRPHEASMILHSNEEISIE